MANIKQKSIMEILSNNDDIYMIPIYQRNYDWNFENAKKLIDDLMSFKEIFQEDNNSLYFLGNMVFKLQPNVDARNTIWTLVDGQQRITTALLILAAIKSLNPDLETSVNQYLFADGGQELKMKLSRMKNEHVLNSILKGKSESITNEDKETSYFQNYIQIQKYLQKKNVNLNSLMNLMKRTSVSWVQLGSNESENKIFETINSTGKPLTSSDLIKNYIFFEAIKFTAVEEQELVGLYIDKIEPIFQNISKDAMDDFFRYFVAIKVDKELPKKGSRKIYKDFITFIKQENYTLSDFESVKKLINDIYHSALIYEISLEEKIAVFSTEDANLKFFQLVFKQNHKTYYGMFYAMLDYWTTIENNKLVFSDEAPTYKGILQLISKYSIYRSICNKMDKNITRDVPKYFSLFLKENTEVTLKEFELFLMNRESEDQKMPTEEELRPSIETLPIYTINKTKTKHILLAAEMGAETTTPFNQFDTKYTIEHIMPQSFEKHWKDKIDFLGKIHTIPNLTLLTNKLNPEVSNSNYEIKKEKILKDSRLKIDGTLSNHDQYDNKFLSDRTDMIIENITSLFK